MNISEQQLDKNFEIGLNIHLISVKLPKKIIKSKDTIRVSITTMPEGNKQHFYMKRKKINCSNCVFLTNITNHTKHIIIVFRKKSILSKNPIIAQKTIHSKEFESFQQEPIENWIFSTEVKTLHIFSHQKHNKENNRSHRNKYLGEMQIKLSFTTPYTTVKENNDEQEIEKTNIKNQKTNKKDQYLDYQKIESENLYNNNENLYSCKENPYNNENNYNNNLF